MRKPQVGDRVRITGFNLNLCHPTDDVIENYKENIKKYEGREGFISFVMNTANYETFPYRITFDIEQDDIYDLWHESEFEVISDKAPSTKPIDIISIYRVLTNRVNYFK